MFLSKHNYLPVTGMLLFLAFLATACNSAPPTPSQVPPTVTPAVIVQPTPAPPSSTAVAQATPTPAAAALQVPFLDQWTGSAHAKADAEPFNHWNTANPKEIPVECAKCHSTPGFQDYTAADGSAFGAVDKPAPTGTVITCVACHNQATLNLTSVKFPSGAEISGLGREVLCMTCHQGTASMVQVDEAIKTANVADDDTVSDKLTFINIHYFAATVTKYGKLVHGGYEYPGKSYDAMFQHVSGMTTCVDCHDPHTLQVRVDKCAACHTGVTKVEDLRNIRMQSSLVDYNGNGNVTEGIAAEISGLQGMLYQAIQAYGKEVTQKAIVYDEATYPYFFVDTNGNGKGDKDELVFQNAYKAWTPRLLRAAYNYQTSVKDPGQFAHGGKYVIELLYDSINDLDTKISSKVDLSKAHRIDAGHFAGSEEAFRHWDADGAVPGTCAKCHSATGLPTFIKDAANITVAASNGLMCETCHSDLQKYTRYAVKDVKFPSGAVVNMDNPDNNLCISCHQGRESKVSVDAAVKGLPPDQPSDKLGFKNVHYFAAGATLFGTEVKGIYEYDGKQYLGKFQHVKGVTNCTDCHDTHALTVKTQLCQGCHQTNDPTQIRAASDTVDYDGDGNKTEGLYGEITTMQEKLYAAIQNYAKTKMNSAIAYDAATYPYFYADADANGKVDQGEKAYATWSPNLLKAAYNYQYSIKDPGAFVHNGKYVIQALYDSIQAMGGSVAGMTRP